LLIKPQRNQFLILSAFAPPRARADNWKEFARFSGPLSAPIALSALEV
jgi:hypothetical protein